MEANLKQLIVFLRNLYIMFLTKVDIFLDPLLMYLNSWRFGQYVELAGI